jgi:hypothetical protein
MLKRVSTSSMMNIKAPSTGNSFPKLSDILVNLSVKNNPVVERKLKLVGDPIGFLEYTDKVYVPGEKGKTVRVPFPDAELNKSFNRIGHDDPSQCPWKKAGYISTLQFAQNCLEQQEDGTWVPKILKKGKSIFQELAKWQSGRLKDLEDLDEDEVDSFITHLGTRRSFPVRIIAKATGKEGPLSVEYEVSVASKELKMTDEMVESLRKAGEPDPDHLAAERKSYEADRKSDTSMPPWEDFFAYGYDLQKIFKHTPVKSAQVAVESETSTYVVKAPKEEVVEVVPVVEIEEELDFSAPAKKAAAKKPPVVIVEDDDDEEDDVDEWA